MSAEWLQYSLLDIYNVTNGLNKNRSEFGFGYPFLSYKEVFYNYFVPDELVNLANTTAKERDKCSVQAGDVFITRTSETLEELGIACVALKDYPNAAFNGFCKRLRPNGKALVDPKYAAFFFKSPEFRQQVLSLTNMSTRASLNNDMLEKLTIKLPPIEIQENIAKVLTDLHEKVQLNQQINETLEQMAQSLFKSWFVDFDPVKAKIAARQHWQAFQLENEPASPICYAPDFDEQSAVDNLETVMNRAAMQSISGKTSDQLDALHAEDPERYNELYETAALFPSTMQECELGEIPEGWECSTIGAEVDIKGGGTPPTKNKEYWEEGDINWTSPKDLSGAQSKVMISTERKITEAGLAKISSGLLPIDTVLMSSRAPVGYLALAKIPVAINQGYIAMICKKRLQPEYILQWAESIMDDIKQLASGSTFAEISKKSFRGIQIVVPAEDLASVYSNIVKLKYLAIELNLKNSSELTEMRDSSLPKLLAGEINLSSQEV